MKIFMYDDEKISQHPSQILEINGNILTTHINIETNPVFKDKTIDTTTLDKNTIYTLNYMIYGYYPFMVSESHDAVSDYAALRIYVSNSGDICLYAPIKTIISPTSTTKDIEIITIDKVNFLHFRDELAQLYPEYKEKNEHIAYHDSLHDILDANYSLACQDAQLEVLTRILLNIIQKNPDLLDDSSKDILSKVESALENTSLLKVKSIDKIKEEIENKHFIRDLQVQYYNMKLKGRDSLND